MCTRVRDYVYVAGGVRRRHISCNMVADTSLTHPTLPFRFNVKRQRQRAVAQDWRVL
jgi:hypothetical protein